MKKYQYFYRKRGQPESEEKTGVINAYGYFHANAKAQEDVGNDYVVTRVLRVKEEQNELSGLSEKDQQSDPRPHK